MTKRTKSAFERRAEYISEDVWFALRERGQKLRKITLRGTFGEWLAILAMSQDDKDYVAFIGAPSLERVIEKIHMAIVNKEIQWKPDEYKRRT